MSETKLGLTEKYEDVFPSVHSSCSTSIGFGFRDIRMLNRRIRLPELVYLKPNGKRILNRSSSIADLLLYENTKLCLYFTIFQSKRCIKILQSEAETCNSRVAILLETTATTDRGNELHLPRPLSGSSIVAPSW
jgi:hypothetical protein